MATQFKYVYLEAKRKNNDNILSREWWSFETKKNSSFFIIEKQGGKFEKKRRQSIACTFKPGNLNGISFPAKPPPNHRPLPLSLGYQLMISSICRTERKQSSVFSQVDFLPISTPIPRKWVFFGGGIHPGWPSQGVVYKSNENDWLLFFISSRDVYHNLFSRFPSSVNIFYFFLVLKHPLWLLHLPPLHLSSCKLCPEWVIHAKY